MSRVRKPSKKESPKGSAKKKRKPKRDEAIVLESLLLSGSSDVDDFKRNLDYDKYYQRAGVKPGTLFRSYRGDASKLQEQLKIYDQARLKATRDDIRRRPQIFKRIDKFKDMLSDHYGKRKLKVIASFSIVSDSLTITTVFTSSKSEHPMAADEIVYESLKKSGLGKYMHFVGSGTSIRDGVRSIYFEESRY